MKTGTISGVLVLFFVFSVFLQTAYAENIITNRTGTIKITNPDGTVLTVEKDESLPDIPSGAVVEILDGSMVVAPAKGFIQVVAGNSAATVKAGDRVLVSIDSATGMADFKVNAGKINVVTANTTVVVKAEQEVQIWLDKIAGVAEIRSIKGVIETITVGVKVLVPEGAIAKISADAETRTILVKSEQGSVKVILINGKIITLAKGRSINTSGSAVGEIQTFPGEVAEVTPFLGEEPAAPERPEGSPYRP